MPTLEDYFRESDKYDTTDIKQIPQEKREELNSRLDELESSDSE